MKGKREANRQVGLMKSPMKGGVLIMAPPGRSVRAEVRRERRGASRARARARACMMRTRTRAVLSSAGWATLKPLVMGAV